MMSKLNITRNILERARDRSQLSADEYAAITRMLHGGSEKSAVAAELTAFPPPVLRALLDDSRLSPNQRAVVALQVHGMVGDDVDREEIYGMSTSNPVDFGSSFALLGGKTPNAELFWNERWYPVILHVQFEKGEDHVSRYVYLTARLSVCELHYPIVRRIAPELFLDDGGEPIELTVLDVLHRLGFRRLQTSSAEFNLKLVRAERASRETGRVVYVIGPVMEFGQRFWWMDIESRALGSPESPRKAVVEPELEVSQEHRGYYAPHSKDTDASSRMPFLRVFSLDMKRYVFVDVDDVEPYEFDEAAMSKLHLPPEMRSVLTRVFETPVERLFGDLVEGKHGGVIILACGKPGVGKTLTAEVYAEQTRRPLYVLELGELGTNVSEVEENLTKVFTRVARWNAVLQFDECEIFLTERGEDLERSAIVGIFLRLLDYYEGILFLTTNRPEVLDHAVRSRVMLRLGYPDLDRTARAVIWEKMFCAAGLSLVDGTLTELAEADINGRQIRNLSRLARILHPGGKVTLEQMRGVLKYGSA